MDTSLLDIGFLTKATGIVFRESFEAVLIYGIIVSYFKKHSQEAEGLKSAQLGLVLGIVASIILGIAFAGALPALSPEMFSYIEIFIIFGGCLMMLYMVFWMSQHAKHLKHDIEAGIKKGTSYSIVGAVFVAVFREGIETVVYLYSLALQKSSLVQRSWVLLSLALGVFLAFLVYRLMIQGSKYLSIKMVFRISGLWLLFSASSLLATGVDRLFSAGYLEKFSEPLFSWEPSEVFAKIFSLLESFAGIRLQPSIIHLVLFLIFWVFVVYKDPLNIRKSSV